MSIRSRILKMAVTGAVVKAKARSVRRAESETYRARQSQWSDQYNPLIPSDRQVGR